MKSSSNNRPATFEQVAPNRYRYNYNVREVEKEEQGADGQTVTTTAYDYDFVEFGGQPNYSTIVRLILREEKNETQEFELVNRYNAVVIGLSNDETAVDEYKAWLAHVEDVKAMVRKDLNDGDAGDSSPFPG